MDNSITLQLAGKSSVAIVIDKSAKGIELKKEASKHTNIPHEAMKILLAGKVLRDDLTLEEQGVKNNAKFMALKAASQQQREEVIKKADEEERKRRVIEAAERISERSEDELLTNYGFELTDQKGNKMDIPAKQKAGLVKGMTLHEKGKACLLEKDLRSALDFFLEADKGFNQCELQLLNLVDNYALLCLDIAWTYFLMQNLDHFKDAAWRLDQAEKMLKNSHGPNQERLIAVKGGACPEMVIYARLFLLQAIVAYHSQNVMLAKFLLDKAEEKIKTMSVTDAEMAPIIQLGFTAREARIGLRAVNKDQNAAVQYLMGKNEQRDNLKNLEREQKRQERKQRLYGYTSKGNKLNIKQLDELVGMGFEESMVAEALKQTDNNNEHALTLLLNNPELLRVNKEPKEDLEPKIQQVMAMGFTTEEARGTLKKTFGNVEAAIDLLLKGEGVVDIPLTDSTLNNNDAEMKTEENVQANNDTEEATMQVDEEYERKKQDEEDFIQDVPKDEEAYLDVDLTDESRILEQYKDLMK
jgi:hypothetical protein